MEDNPVYNQSISAARSCISHLEKVLRFIETCFSHILVPKTEPLSISMSYHGQEDVKINGIKEIRSDLLRCLLYQTENRIKINIDAHITIIQNILIEGQVGELYYYGQLHLFDPKGVIFFCNYDPTPQIEIDLDDEIPVERVLVLFNHLQETIVNQIQKVRESMDNPVDNFLGRIADTWISYIKDYHETYYLELEQNGTLLKIAKEKEDEYYEMVEEMKDKYPPGGAEEVARMFLYPKFYP